MGWVCWAMVSTSIFLLRICQRSQDWQKALILNSPNPPNLLLDQLGVAPSPPGTIEQHNNLIHNLPLHYLEQRGTPTLRLFWDHLVFFNPPWDALIAREGAFPRDGGSDSVKRVPKGEKKWSHPVSYCDIDDV